ncbi:MAG: 4Fe-4S binding protein [Candidatus Schekmanbacteria bacterium]|nr:4Fe-4S binding protein [Candidatus Schekmanbacteria bacterium]
MKYISNVSTLKYSPELCKGCGICAEVCPHGVFMINGNKKASITDIDLCMECGACEMNCAFGAISVKAGVGCAAAIINGMISGGEPSCGCGCSCGEKAEN